MSNIRTNSKSAAPAVPVGFGKVIFVIVPRFNMATLIIMIETLRIANYLTPEPVFSWKIVSFDGSQIAASNGMSVAATTPPSECTRGDMIFVLGSWGCEIYANRSHLAWLRRQSRAAVPLCSVELSCYILARAGVMQGASATTHWS